jgi:hypothetical protein
MGETKHRPGRKEENESIRFTRGKPKPNLHGEDKEIESSGQELVILIKRVPTGGCRAQSNGE